MSKLPVDLEACVETADNSGPSLRIGVKEGSLVFALYSEDGGDTEHGFMIDFDPRGGLNVSEILRAIAEASGRLAALAKIYDRGAQHSEEFLQ